MNPKKIAVVGAGQLGSRHLQALSLIEQPIEIWVVDPENSSLTRAKDRWEQTKPASNKSIHFESSMSALPKRLDSAIVATSAGPRFQVTSQLLKETTVDFLVLEKILFPRLSEYEQMAKILRDRTQGTWVNCSFRMIPFYKRLKDQGPVKALDSWVTGSSIRLASNLIHHLDLISFLTDDTSFELDFSGMNQELTPSKRAGYCDWEGVISVRYKNGSQHIHRSWNEGQLPMTVNLSHPRLHFIHRTNQNLISSATPETEWKWKEEMIPFPMQSTMTAEICTGLLNGGNCPLTRYEESARLHTQMIDQMLKELNKRKLHSADELPFT
jgi:predicted dehydrogenase